MATPPLPPGFTLDQPGQAVPPLPPGFTLDSAALSQATGAQASPSLAMAPVGGAELLGKFVTGAVASIPAAAAYGGAAVGKAFGANVDPADLQSRVQNYFTYQPKSDSGKAGEQTIANAARPVVEPLARKYGEATQAVAAKSPFAGELMKAAPGAFQAAGAIVPAVAGVRAAATAPFRPTEPRVPVQTAESIVSRLNTPQSMGAASAAPSLTNVSSDLRQAIVTTAQKTGGAINPDVLARHVEADTLPVPIRLSEGQATQNPRLISQEMNTRGATAMTEHLNAQNGQLAENMRAIRDQAGPDVFTTSPVEHGETLIAAYRAKDAAAQAQINGLYDTLRNVSGGDFPVDANALLKSATKALHQKLLYDHAPAGIMTTLNRLTKQGMTFENFEALRTNLARIQRSSMDGNERAAAGVIRDSMEELPLGPASSQIKPYADAARAAYRAQAQALDADPAYKAAVTESVPPDRFVTRFVLNAPREDVATMRTALAGNEPALQTMSVAALDHLRSAAKLDPQYRGNFASQSFNNALVKLDPKLRDLVSPEVSETLEKLGNVARYTTSQPRGAFVNNSNTFVAGAASHAANIAETVANKAAMGIPVGTWTRNALAAGRQQNAFARATAPGAGLGRLEERH